MTEATMEHASTMLTMSLIEARPLIGGDGARYASNASKIARQSVEIFAAQIAATCEQHQRESPSELFFHFGAMLLGIEMLKIFEEWDRDGLPTADGACGDALGRAAMIVGDRVARMSMLD